MTIGPIARWGSPLAPQAALRRFDGLRAAALKLPPHQWGKPPVALARRDGALGPLSLGRAYSWDGLPPPAGSNFRRAQRVAWACPRKPFPSCLRKQGPLGGQAHGASTHGGKAEP